MKKMKKMNQNKFILLFLFISFNLFNNTLTAQNDSVKPENVVRLHYFNINGKMQYLVLESLLKNGRVFTPHSKMTYEIYLDSAAQKNLVSSVTTDEEGKGKAFIPPALKSIWDASSQHTFIVKQGDEEVLSDYTITKAKITIDTSTVDGVKNITATVMDLKNSEWVPISDVEMRVGIKRLVGIVSAGDEPTYTTDSTGSVTVELKKDSMPGDQKGNLVLAVKIQDNDEIGNLLMEKTVPWGKVTEHNTTFFEQRTLWSTRFKTPYWLLFTVYSIAIGIWGTLIYLVFRIIKIGKLGKQFAMINGSDEPDDI
ncbi:MAG: hypothetical protein Q8891_09995 [Bacteroidota bacterium]|nr:hypothetical protein [Bacteroidota bacterium]